MGLWFQKSLPTTSTEHNFDVQLSFDGVREAQLYRGHGTFEILNRVFNLYSFRDEHAQLFTNRLRIALTVVPETVSFLAKSVQYLLEKDVRETSINPCITPYPGWRSDKIHELDEEFARIAEYSRNHVEHTGAIPVTLLRKATNEIPKKGTRAPACNALTGKALAIDVDGQLYTCPMLVESYQKFPPVHLMEQVSILKLGHVTDPEAHNRRAALAESARRSDLWTAQGCCFLWKLY